MMQADREELLKLIRLHLRWYPLMELRDVYKLLYQGVMGPEHIIASAEKFKASLMDELLGLTADPSGRLFESVSGDGTLLRINLRPMKNQPVEPDELVKVLLKTAECFSGSQPALQDTWVGFIMLCETGVIKQFPLKTVHGFGAWLGEMAFPAVHHSDIYRRAYKPAYRLISSQLVSSLGLELVSNSAEDW